MKTKVGIDPTRPIGRGNPPRNEHAFFKKGKTGNPKGRPSRPHRLTILKAVCDAPTNETIYTVLVKKYGEQIFVKVPAKELYLIMLVRKALQGNVKAYTTIMKMIGEWPVR